MPATALTRVQLGYETPTWGSAVAATAKLMGVTEANVKPVDKVIQIVAPGSLAPSSMSAQASTSGAANIAAAASYEDLNFFLHGLFGHITPGGSVGVYTYTYGAPISAAPTLHPFSMEFGATGASYVMAGALLTKFGLKIAVGDVWRVTSDWVGKSVATVTLAALSDRTVNLIRAADTQLTIEATWSGTIGTTVVAATLISADLSVDTGRHLKEFIQSSLSPLTYGEDRWKGTLKLTLEFNATAKAYVDALLTPSKVQKLIQLKAVSGALIAYVNFAGTLTNGVELFKDRDGNMIIELTFSGEYNPTLTNWLGAFVTNAVATLP